MMATHAVNHGTKENKVEPGLQEIRELMFTGKLHIAGHNSELIEQMRMYHRDQDFRVVKERDHLIDAMRYAIMMRRSGRARSECDGVGFGAMPFAGQRRERSGPQLAKGLDFDVFNTSGY
jgi:hypothetical protein